MSDQHTLAERYLDAVYDLPDDLRVRRALEDELAAIMTGGGHVVIRGFWRIGKTTLLKGVLKRATERTGGTAFVLDLRDPDDKPLTSGDAVLARITAKVQDFLNRVGAAELKADPKRPLAILGELAAPIFLGFDELIALATLPPEQAVAVVTALLDAPKNVKVALVCHRHRAAEALFATHVYSHAGISIADVPCISDDELVQLVQTPALAEGVKFSNEAMGELADITGNRPWELLVLGHVVAATLKPDFKGDITPEQVDACLDLDVLMADEEGAKLVDTCLRMLVTAMNVEERALLEMLASGNEGEATEDAVRSLSEAGWLITSDEGYSINGALMEGIARAVAAGEIKVSVE